MIRWLFLAVKYNILTMFSSNDIIFIIIIFFIQLIDKTYAHPHTHKDVLICRHCGHDIVKASDLEYFPATKVVQSRESTILGIPDILVQLLRNPQGSTFDVITATDAQVLVDSKVYQSDSWFEDTAWQITRCPRCHSQMGWKYQPSDSYDEEEVFHGLILNHLVHEDYM
ncbi:uncharacterized protein [Antedon mediterranea]|uniref:uncharacterized protein isoform X2 n=1 Tax=Antedon mediterranea TaxID=105859 RepID=UPI003AF80968